jgi:K+-transporting ATPase ATPase A chain
MSGLDWTQVAVFVAALGVLAVPIGRHVATTLSGGRTILTPVLGWLERGLLRLAGVDTREEMSWHRYAKTLLLFSAGGWLVVYLMQRLQHLLPLNPAGLGPVDPDLAFNTAWSFVTNTNWQSYAGEVTLSYLTQMTALGVQNFVSAAAGLAVLAALIRGFQRRESATLGNFWVDLVRSTVHILLPLSVVLALALVWQGVPQTFHAPVEASPISATEQPQTIPLGPAASQIAIKQLGTNGGGFYNTNSAHPLENPTPLSNLLEMVAILLLPIACVVALGRMLGDRRQAIAILAAMSLIFAGGLALTIGSEHAGTPALSAAVGASVGNLEGKEVRFGITNSAIWAVSTTAASNGSVNSMHDSYTPLGGLVPMLMMQLGEVVFGGVGSGLYGMLLFAIIAVFVAGLMVGRTPEYLGKKIEPFEMKMAMVAILVPAIAVLVGTAAAVVTPAGLSGLQESGAHGLSEVLYAFSSAGNNNGSAFAGLSADQSFYNILLGIAMFAGRFLVALPVLALAGSLAAKRPVPTTAGTLPTHGPLFVTLLVGTVLLVGVLTFVPALALGPIVEHLMMTSGVTP